jgi:hypothetical protein
MKKETLKDLLVTLLITVSTVLIGMYFYSVLLQG